jgi:hypothetical protein
MKQCEEKYCGSFAVKIDPAEKLCDVHFYKVQRDEFLEILKTLVSESVAPKDYKKARSVIKKTTKGEE